MALPELTQASADIWATAIWKSVLRTSNGKPEDNPDLRKIGEYRKRHSEHIGQQKKVTQKTEKANIRDGIRDRIFKAVRAIAR